MTGRRHRTTPVSADVTDDEDDDNNDDETGEN
jgi:hypothetical protein